LIRWALSRSGRRSVRPGRTSLIRRNGMRFPPLHGAGGHGRAGGGHAGRRCRPCRSMPPVTQIDDTPPPQTGPSRLQVPPWVQLVGLPLIVVFGYVFVRAASHAVVVFLVAGLISLLLAPVV